MIESLKGVVCARALYLTRGLSISAFKINLHRESGPQISPTTDIIAVSRERAQVLDKGRPRLISSLSAKRESLRNASNNIITHIHI